MRSAVCCPRDDQPMPMHGDGLRDIVADLRDHLLAAPHPYRRPEIGSVDAVGGRLAVAYKPHRAGSGIEPDPPAGVGSELNRNWKRWLRASCACTLFAPSSVTAQATPARNIVRRES